MGQSMRVHVSDTSAALLQDKFELQPRDAIQVKGKGAHTAERGRLCLVSHPTPQGS